MEKKQLDFIEKAIDIHGDKYDYSKVIFKSACEDVIIICKKHSYEFEQRPNNHIHGANCPKCGLEARSEKRRTSINDFIEKANEKHNNKFDYSKVIYINSNTHVIVICPEHGEFTQTPHHHIGNKFGCNKCSINHNAANKIKDNSKFLDELKERYGDIFDYSKVIYIHSKKPIILICKKHNKEFNMRPNTLLNSKICCPDCVADNKKTMNIKPLTTFIEEANAKHNNKFDYSKVIYKNSKTRIIVICPEHGDINITPHQHLTSPFGCQKCAGKYRRSQDEFIEDAIKIHGDKYDYSKVEYKNNHTNVIIYCKKHNIDFCQTPVSHLSGCGCSLCGYEIGNEKRKYTKDEFITMAKNRFPNNLDDYSSINYINLSTKVDIKCNIHGIYSSLPADHLQGHRCMKCAKDKLSLQFRLSKEEFIKRSNEKHNNLYNYNNVEYVNSDVKVIIECPEHGKFLQTPHNHMNGAGCKRCSLTGCSKGQIEWLKFLATELNLKIEHHENGGEHRIKASKKYDADGYCKEINTIFEFQGCYYHGCKKCFPSGTNPTSKKSYCELYEKTIKKKEYCINEGYKYIEIWECEWTKIKKTDELLDKYISNLKKDNPYLINNIF
jgi:G:T-mismatch repair DNA endonuclease (very short patch repair protein)